MELNNVISLYNEGQAYCKRVDDLCQEMPGLVSINPYYGYIQLTPDAFAEFVKDVDSIKSTPLTTSDGWNHEAVVNGVTFVCVTEREDIYETV